MAETPWTGLRLSLEQSWDLGASGKEVFEGVYQCHNVNPYNENEENTQVPSPSPWDCLVAVSMRRYLKALSLLLEKLSLNSISSENSSTEGHSFTIYVSSSAFTIWFNAFKNPKQNLVWKKKKLGLKHDQYPKATVFFHSRDRPAKSIIISPSFFLFKLNPDKFRTKIPWKRHATDSLLGIGWVRSYATCWGLGSQNPESLPSQT